MLALSAVATGVLSEVLVSAIEPTIEETGIGEVFIGLIIVPLVGNVAEHFAAVKIAWGGNIDFSAGIALNSALQVALAVSAVAVGAGLVFGNDVDLVFPNLEIAVLVAATLLATVVALNGNANWLEGAELLSIYAMAAHRVLVPVGRPPQPRSSASASRRSRPDRARRPTSGPTGTCR